MGHKVRNSSYHLCFLLLSVVCFRIRKSTLLADVDVHDYRVGCPRSPCLTTASGSHRAHPTGACGSGTCKREKYNSCFMDIRVPIRPARLHACVRRAHVSLLNIFAHARTHSSLHRPESNGRYAGYMRRGWGEVMCVPLTPPYKIPILTLMNQLAGSYTTL